MKKTIFLMLGMAAMLASCSQDELDGALGSGTAVITATVDDGIATRSTYDKDDVDITRCLLEVRDGEGNLVGKQHETTKGTDDTYTFTVRGLDPDETYTYLFWADNGSAYTATDLTAVTMVDEKEAEALAFSGTTTGKPGEISATLTHAVAKVTLKTTGSLIKDDKVKAEISGAAKTLNVLKGEASGEAQYDGEATMTEDMTAGEVMTFYVPASAEGQVADMKITFTAVDGNASLPKDVSNVPLRANYRTLISGDIGNIGATDVTATLTTDWNDNESQEFVRYEINLETAGTLTDEMIDKAIAQNGRRIVIKGKVNQADINKLVGDGRSHNLNIVSIDMSNATLDDQNKAWPYSYTGVEVGSEGGTLEAVVLPEGIESLANSAFQDQTNLKTIKLPSTLVSIGDNAFQGSHLTEITIPEGVTTIGREAFQGAHLSGELTIPKNVTSIGYHAFDGITKITSLVWNTNLTLSKEAFSFCPELTTVTINGNVSSFDAEIATNFPKLKTITFTSVTDVPEFAGNDLSSFGQVKIYVPENLADAFKAADGWSQFADNIYPLQ